MDLDLHEEQNILDHFLLNGSFDVNFKIFENQNEQEPLHEPKQQGQIIKKKGRPKGLKSTKSKTQTKEVLDKPNKNTGHWLKQQNKRYHWFLEIHSNHFIHRHLRRMDKIFKTMADFIGSREAEQCRSHHQKMQKKYLSFYKIIKNLRNQFYLSCDPSHIQAELQSNNIYQFDPLISAQILQNERQEKQLQNEAKQSSVHLEPVEKQYANHSFFLGDNYENGLNYHNF